jgi:hypothetical protein
MSQVTALDRISAGDVGIFDDEQLQRLLSIFSEAMDACLLALGDIVKKRAAGSPDKERQLYRTGLKSIPTWNADVLRDEVARMEAAYPETRLLVRYGYIKLLSERAKLRGRALQPAASRETSTALSLPSLDSTYLSFLRRVCAAHEIAEVGAVQLPRSLRRGVYLDALRNALHDLARDVPDLEPERLEAEERRNRKSGETRDERQVTITGVHSQMDPTVKAYRRQDDGDADEPMETRSAASDVKSDVKDLVRDHVKDHLEDHVGNGAGDTCDVREGAA